MQARDASLEPSATGQRSPSNCEKNEKRRGSDRRCRRPNRRLGSLRLKGCDEWQNRLAREGTAREAGGECDVLESRSAKTLTRSIPGLGASKSFTGCFIESICRVSA